MKTKSSKLIEVQGGLYDFSGITVLKREDKAPQPSTRWIEWFPPDFGMTVALAGQNRLVVHCRAGRYTFHFDYGSPERDRIYDLLKKTIKT